MENDTNHSTYHCATLMARFMETTWGSSGSDRTQVGPMLAPWTLLSGKLIPLNTARPLQSGRWSWSKFDNKWSMSHPLRLPIGRSLWIIWRKMMRRNIDRSLYMLHDITAFCSMRSAYKFDRGIDVSKTRIKIMEWQTFSPSMSSSLDLYHWKKLCKPPYD